MRRHRLTDREWMLLPAKRRTGRPPKDHRLILDALLWLAKTGAARACGTPLRRRRKRGRLRQALGRSCGGFGSKLHVR